MNQGHIYTELSKKIDNLEIKQLDKNCFLVRGFYQGKNFKSSLLYNSKQNNFNINLNGYSWTIAIDTKKDYDEKSINNKSEVHAPMTGIIKDVLVSNDQKVIAGQNLVKIESMKMILNITANFDGTVADIKTEIGKKVSAGDFLLRINND